jgi:hypothetical protein
MFLRLVVTVLSLLCCHSPAIATEKNITTASDNSVTMAQISGTPPVLYHHDIDVYDVDISLSQDRDHDGYYSQLEVSFDVDTYRDSQWLYAELYLHDDAVSYHYHTTNDFVIYGQSPFDVFAIDSQLSRGFPSQYYELSIYLYDALTGQLLTVVNSHQSYYSPPLLLESTEYDQPAILPVYPGRPNVISHEHGGSAGYLLVLCCLISVYRRLRITKSIGYR